MFKKHKILYSLIKETGIGSITLANYTYCRAKPTYYNLLDLAVHYEMSMNYLTGKSDARNTSLSGVICKEKDYI